MFDPVLIFLCLIVFIFWKLRENETNKNEISNVSKPTDQTENMQDKLIVNQTSQARMTSTAEMKKMIDELEEEQQVLIYHLKKAIQYGDNEAVAHSLAQKKIMHLQEEIKARENENRSILDKLTKKESILLTISEQRLQYKKAIDKMVKEQFLMNQQIEFHNNELLDSKQEIERLKKRISQLDAMKRTNKLSTLLEVDQELYDDDFKIENSMKVDEDYESGTRL